VETRKRFSRISCSKGSRKQLLGLRNVRKSSLEAILSLELGKIDRLFGINLLYFILLYHNVTNEIKTEKFLYVVGSVEKEDQQESRSANEQVARAASQRRPKDLRSYGCLCTL